MVTLMPSAVPWRPFSFMALRANTSSAKLGAGVGKGTGGPSLSLSSGGSSRLSHTGKTDELLIKLHVFHRKYSCFIVNCGIFWFPHSDVISELEKISFVATDVGRCRAWLRLALNHGLLECYLASLFREDSKLQAHYQPGALLLNAEEREVLLSYLQGLASLTFSLSYKSSVLNEWTTTPLALAGLCPMFQTETHDLPLNGGDLPPSNPRSKELWDTESQSSSSSDVPDVQKRCPLLKESVCESGLNTSNLSLDTTGSSQLSSSLSSDSLLQGQEPRSPAGEHWSSCDLDINVISSRPQE